MERAAGNLRTTASRVLNKTRDARLEKVEQTYRIAKEALAHTIWGSALQNRRIPPATSGSERCSHDVTGSVAHSLLGSWFYYSP